MLPVIREMRARIRQKKKGKQSTTPQAYKCDRLGPGEFHRPLAFSCRYGATTVVPGAPPRHLSVGRFRHWLGKSALWPSRCGLLVAQSRQKLS